MSEHILCTSSAPDNLRNRSKREEDDRRAGSIPARFKAVLVDHLSALLAGVFFSTRASDHRTAMMMTKRKKKKNIQEAEEEEEQKPNPGGGGGVGGGGSTSTSISSTAGSGGPDDRIGELPVEILHHILGFLEMDELLIGTSLVSTKWRYLWKSVSTLKFTHCPPVSSSRLGSSSSISRIDSGSVTSVGSDGDSVKKYQNFVDHVLRLRDSEASKIQIFRYIHRERGGYEDYLERIHNFIVSAVVNQGAQEIQIICFYLDESNDNRIHFNPSIFTSGRLLRKFTFVVFNRHYLIQFPRSLCCATQLTHLDLDNIRLPEGDDSNAELHLVCPLLETLSISRCISEHLKVLDISAPKLNSLSIYNVGMRYEDFDGLGGCRIEIRTPNLTSLYYSGCVYVDCFTENLPHLDFASLSFTKETGMTEKTTSFAIKLLKGLTTAEFLILARFEAFSPDTLSDLLTPFTSLRTLKLATNCNISSIHGMVHFLNSCNSIEKLVWEVYEFVEVEGDEHLMLPQCRLSHLKHVHIKRLRGHENEIEFVKFLLKSSVVLEEIIIHTTADSPNQSIEEKLKQFIEEEPSVRRSIKLLIL